MSEQSDELTMWEVAGLLRLPVRMARRWCLRKVPSEAIRRQGRCLFVTTWGLNHGLAKCVWRPKPRRGYQYRAGRRPVNVHCRDAQGRFTSHNVDRQPQHRPFVHSRRARYLSDAD